MVSGLGIRTATVSVSLSPEMHAEMLDDSSAAEQGAATVVHSGLAPGGARERRPSPPTVGTSATRETSPGSDQLGAGVDESVDGLSPTRHFSTSNSASNLERVRSRSEKLWI